MTRKEKAIRKVILQRVTCIDKLFVWANLSPQENAYYQGKREGLMQAYSLIEESLESIKIELPQQ